MKTPAVTAVPPVAVAGSPGAEARRRQSLLTAVWSVLLALFFGATSLASPQSWGELDSSWVLGLVWWFRHLAGGSPVFFTYGPLGWLTQAVSYTRPEAALALLFLFCATAALAFLVIVGLREHVGWVGAVVGAGVCLRLAVPEAETLGTITVLACLLIVRSGRTYRALPATLGAWAAFVVLIKPGTGIGCLLCAAVMSIRGGERLRSLGVAALSSVVTLVACWVLIGQPIAALLPWVRASMQLMSGYWIMMYEDPALHSQYWAMLILTVLCIGFAARGSDRRWRTLALFLPFAFLTLKHGFVRHGGQGSSAIASVTAVLVGCLGRPAAPPRRWVRLVATVGVAAVSVLALQVNHVPWHTLEPTTSGPEALSSSVSTLISTSRWEREHRAAAAAITTASGLSPAMAEQLTGGAQVDPWAVWTLWPQNELWRPVPAFQQYFAYTPFLDRANAAALTGSHAPTTILRRLYGGDIDDRFPLWDAPAYQVAVVCHYAVTSSDSVWQLLRRAPADRCGPEQLLGTEAVAEGGAIAVPAPRDSGSVVIARFRTSTPLWYRARALLFKPTHVPVISIDGVRYRLVLPTLDDPMLVHLPTAAPSSVGGGVGLTVQSLTVDSPVSGTVSFYEIPYR